MEDVLIDKILACVEEAKIHNYPEYVLRADIMNALTEYFDDWREFYMEELAELRCQIE